jgi:ATP-dependent DNA helicase RecQ
MLRRDDAQLVATRPTDSMAGVYPPLDVEALKRRRDVEVGKLRTMIDLAYHRRCRRQFILEYFGDQEWASRDRKCGACDNCVAVARGLPTGLSESEQKAVRSLLGLVGSLNGRFGRKRIADLASGADIDPRFIELPERGCLRGWPQRQVMDLLNALEGAALVEASRGQYPTVAITRRGDQAAAGTVDLASIGIEMPAVKKRRRKR